MRILAVDYGDARTGLAICDRGELLASPIGVFHSGDREAVIKEITRQVAEQKAKTGKQVLGLLQETCRRTGRTVIVITHNTALTAMADRVIQVRSGQIVSNKVNEHPVPVEEIEW